MQETAVRWSLYTYHILYVILVDCLITRILSLILRGYSKVKIIQLFEFLIISIKNKLKVHFFKSYLLSKGYFLPILLIKS